MEKGIRSELEEKINRSDNIVIDVFDGKFVFYNAK